MVTTVSSKFLLSTAVSNIDGLCTGDTTVLLLICHWCFPSLKMCDCDAPPANISMLMLIIYLCRSLHNVCMMWECDLHSIGGVRTNQGGQWCQWAGWGPQTEGFYSKPLSCWIYFEHEYIFESFVETDWHIYRLMQERCNSSALATEFRLFCTYPSIWSWKFSLEKKRISLTLGLYSIPWLLILGNIKIYLHFWSLFITEITAVFEIMEDNKLHFNTPNIISADDLATLQQQPR